MGICIVFPAIITELLLGKTREKLMRMVDILPLQKEIHEKESFSSH